VAMKLNGVEEQPQAQPASRRRVPVVWPWVVVIAAWTLGLVAVLTNQTELIDHRYLLQQSHLPWLLALLLFLACWQVMTIAMMLPSSMPMIYMMVHAGQKQGRPRTIPLAFLAGYAVIWTAFACAAFLMDTQIHRLVAGWFWLYMHSWLIGAVTFALAGAFQFSPLKERCLNLWRSPLVFLVRYYRYGRG
jgi:predicted metal-binding membrane protein